MSALKKVKPALFSIGMLKKAPYLIPLVGFSSCSVLGGIAMGIYSLYKLDVILDHGQNLPPWERIDLGNPKITKLLVVEQECPPNPQLQALKEEISSHYV